ncbi:thiopurine S-methyltransferase [Alteromonas gilva]|uniref:Thiopurine S-methyltransferase n=1 Tax=Alteromonas gilva TaxID=2987522 RepID=A0ABT5KWX6_9ALTE|nr:thiopurine S-methyltransferase [Alteromonas gilva]MDC8829272.1 thiopurine S-methyltransferase [Alteromonas gilva]
MQHHFWHNKWEKGEIGFHQDDTHPMLMRFANELGFAGPCRVLVPLCGKSHDMTYLLKRGCEVIGVELSQVAVEQYFAAQDIVPDIAQRGDLLRYKAPGITLFCGDFFALKPEYIGSVDAVYDRAALVALPASMRMAYCQQVLTLAPQAKQLLITFEYDQSALPGPPFAIPFAEIHQYYGKHREVTELISEPLAGGLKGTVPATEHAWLIGSAPR